MSEVTATAISKQKTLLEKRLSWRKHVFSGVHLELFQCLYFRGNFVVEEKVIQRLKWR